MRIEPIIIIDDDIEDLELLKEIAKEMHLPGEVITFNNPEIALDFLKSTILEPLFILCDVNMPKLNGFQLRKELLAIDSTIRDVPFLFLSTSKTDRDTSYANALKIHAYYVKPTTFTGMKDTFENIITLLNIRS